MAGPQIGMHSFPHQLVRPPSTSAVPLFTVDSPHGLPTVPVVSIAVTKGNLVQYVVAIHPKYIVCYCYISLTV